MNTIIATVNTVEVEERPTVEYIPLIVSPGTATVVADITSLIADGRSQATITVTPLNVNRVMLGAGQSVSLSLVGAGTLSSVRDNGDADGSAERRRCNGKRRGERGRYCTDTSL